MSRGKKLTNAKTLVNSKIIGCLILTFLGNYLSSSLLSDVQGKHHLIYCGIQKNLCIYQQMFKC